MIDIKLESATASKSSTVQDWINGRAYTVSEASADVYAYVDLPIEKEIIYISRQAYQNTIEEAIQHGCTKLEAKEFAIAFFEGVYSMIITHEVNHIIAAKIGGNDEAADLVHTKSFERIERPFEISAFRIAIKTIKQIREKIGE